MRAVMFLGDRKLEVQTLPDPTPGPGEAVLQIKASGMCGSDLKFYRSPPGAAQAALGLGGDAKPMIAGHEPCGVVAAVGPGVPENIAAVGMRVMQHHYAGCGACEHCRVGWSQLCPNGFTVYGVTGHGAHAEYMIVPARTLVPLPDELPFSTGAAISCGTGTAYGALRRINLSGHDTLAVFGQGPVGLAAVQLGKAMGARVIAIDITPERLALAKDFGADYTIDPGADDPVEAIKEITRGRGVDKSVDCSGSPEARIAAVRSCCTWGTACMVGEGNELVLDVSPDLLRKQLTVVGSWTFSAVGQAECARFVAERGIDVERQFTQRWTLEQAEEAYTLFDTQTTGKAVFEM